MAKERSARRYPPLARSKKFAGPLIPEGLLCHTTLPMSAKALWARLRQYSYTSGKCYPKQSRLAIDLGLKRRQVQKLIDVLVEHGLLEVRRPSGKDRVKHLHNSYRLLHHPLLDQKPAERTPREACSSAPASNCTLLKASSKLLEPAAAGPSRALPTSNGRYVSRNVARESTPKGKNPFADKWVKLSKLFADAVHAHYDIDIRQKGRVIVHAKPLQWLKRNDGVPYERIEAVVTWLARKLHEGSPPAGIDVTATSYLRTKFGPLEQTMLREAMQAPVASHLKPAKNACRALREYTGLKLDPGPVSNLMHAVDAWTGRVMKLAKRKTPGAYALLQYIWQVRTTPLSHEYVEWAFGAARQWKGWRGGLAGFYPGEKHWQEFVTQRYRATGDTPDKQAAYIMMRCIGEHE